MNARGSLVSKGEEQQIWVSENLPFITMNSHLVVQTVCTRSRQDSVVRETRISCSHTLVSVWVLILSSFLSGSWNQNMRIQQKAAGTHRNARFNLYICFLWVNNNRKQKMLISRSWRRLVWAWRRGAAWPSPRGSGGWHNGSFVLICMIVVRSSPDTHRSWSGWQPAAFDGNWYEASWQFYLVGIQMSCSHTGCDGTGSPWNRGSFRCERLQSSSCDIKRFIREFVFLTLNMSHLKFGRKWIHSNTKWRFLLNHFSHHICRGSTWRLWQLLIQDKCKMLS